MLLHKCRRLKPVFEVFDTFLIDCDGVLWNSEQAVPGVEKAIQALREQNKQVIFVSNNCGKTVNRFQELFHSLLGLEDVSSKNIITSAVSTAIYLKSRIKEGMRVYVIGQSAFIETLKQHGIDCFGIGPVEPKMIGDWKDFVPDKSVKYVVASYDPYFTHTKLTEAYIYITENNAEYLASDTDQYFSVSTRKVPGSLPIQAAITAVVNRAPIVTGKPDPFLMTLLQEEHGKFDLDKTIMIGDTYGTDVLFGKNCGISTAVVLTGNTKAADIQGFAQKPDHVLDSLGDLLQSD